MSVSVKLLAHSINLSGHDITSWELEYNKSIHAELMTHRQFSRNAGSSRAIPFAKALSSVEQNPALPIVWGGHKPGMSPGEPLTGGDLLLSQNCDEQARMDCTFHAKMADDYGLHKSITNRWIDPWSHIKVLVTTTQLNNFFKLRCHPAAEPIFQCLAFGILQKYVQSVPRRLKEGEWHMPYHDFMPSGLTVKDQLKIATARACWVSYNSPDKTDFDLDAAFARHDSCISMGHWSPLEHCAMAFNANTVSSSAYPWSNFDDPFNDFRSGWKQYRKCFPDEHAYQEFDLLRLLATRPDFTRDPSFNL